MNRRTWLKQAPAGAAPASLVGTACVLAGANDRIWKAIHLLHAGVIGEVYRARWIIAASREPIGFQKPEPPPFAVPEKT